MPYTRRNAAGLARWPVSFRERPISFASAFQPAYGGEVPSLRDIVSNLGAQPGKLYHLGIRLVSRSSLARVNAEQPYTLYEALFGRLLTHCQQQAPRHGFRFRNPLYALDATTIDLCLAVFPWASFARRPRSSCMSD